MLNSLVVFSIWVSLAAAACPLLVSLVYDLPLQPMASLIAFLCAFFVYSMDKVSGSVEDLLNTPGRAILAKYPVRQMAIAAYLAAWLCVAMWDISKWPCVAVFGLAGWLYAQKIAGHRLKDVPGLKGPYVAATCTICFAGLVGTGYSLIFLLILINTILFDVRDIAGDRAAGVKTIPVLAGLSRTLWLLAALDAALLWISPIPAMIGAALIWYFRVQRPSLEYDIFVDGWPILAEILIFLQI